MDGKDYLSYPYNIFQYSSVLFRNIDGLTYGMDKGIYGGDLVLSINLLKRGRAFYFLDDYFSTYRIHENGVWNKNGKLKKAIIKVADYKILREIFSEYSKEINKIFSIFLNIQLLIINFGFLPNHYRLEYLLFS